MRHTTLNHLFEEMLDDNHEFIITSNSKQFALYNTGNGAMHFLKGDFSGTPEEQEAEARRILNGD